MQFLLKKHYNVFGLFRILSTSDFWRLRYLNNYNAIKLISGDSSNLSSVMEAFYASAPVKFTTWSHGTLWKHALNHL